MLFRGNFTVRFFDCFLGKTNLTKNLQMKSGGWEVGVGELGRVSTFVIRPACHRKKNCKLIPMLIVVNQIYNWPHHQSFFHSFWWVSPLSITVHWICNKKVFFWYLPSSRISPCVGTCSLRLQVQWLLNLTWPCLLALGRVLIWVWRQVYGPQTPPHPRPTVHGQCNRTQLKPLLFISLS